MKLLAEKRANGKSSHLRREGRLPAVVYNKGVNIPISVEKRAFDKVFRRQGTASIIDLDIGGDSHDVLVKAVQMDKRRREPLHVDFYAVTAGQAVDVFVPLELVGTAAGTREGGQLDIKRREIHISIIPRLIPSAVSVDISALDIGDSLHINDLKELFPAEAEILDDGELTIITVVPPRVAVEVEEEELEEAEPEVIAKGKEEEEEGQD